MSQGKPRKEYLLKCAKEDHKPLDSYVTKYKKENIDGKDVELIDLGICDGRINEKALTEEELIKYLNPIDNKFILDACCGAKFIWINKNNPYVIYNDIRKEKKGFLERRKNIEINPDINYDFRKLPFKDNKFKLIIFDPPHLLGKMDKSTLKACYGVLNKDNYIEVLGNGIKELWRVLDNYGILFFKFNNIHIRFEDLIILFPEKPLFQTSTNRSKNCESRWFCFMKIPEVKHE